MQAMESISLAARLFDVKSVAIVGASEEAGRIGSGLCKSAAGFPGPVYYVNPGYQTLWGQPCFPSVLDIPETPSHAVIAVVRHRVPQCLAQCAEKGIRSVVVISAGFKETDELGARLERDMARFCRERDIALLGPNTLGLIDTSISYNGTFLPDSYPAGPVSVISQSGGVGMALLSSLRDQRCGVAKWAGIGNEAVLDASSLLRYFAKDEATRVIAVCFEGLRDLPGVLRLAAQVSRTKPVVLLRDGIGAVGRQAAASHTGAMTQRGDVMSGLIRQFGLLEAHSCRECAAMLKALALAPPPAGDRAVILTNTAGPSILAADAMEPAGIKLPSPTGDLRRRIDEAAGVSMELKNPADISSNGLTPRNYGIAAGELLRSGEYDILLGFFTLSTHLILPDRELTEAVQKAGKPAVACFLGPVDDFHRYDPLPEKAGIPCYCDTQDAASAMIALVRQGQLLRRETAGAEPVLTDACRAAAARYLEALPPVSTGVLPELASKEFLRLAGAAVEVPVPASGPEEAVRAAARWGWPAALKVHSERIVHKSDVGGVRLGLRDAGELTAAWHGMLPAMRALDPEARLAVQPMYPEGFELILGAARLEGLGPVVMAGMGGVWSEALGDVAFRLAPLAEGEPERMLDSLRCTPILDGFRGTPLDREGPARLIRLLAELMEAFPQIREIDLNPCRVYPDKTAILDARVVLQAT